MRKIHLINRIAGAVAHDTLRQRELPKLGVQRCRALPAAWLGRRPRRERAARSVRPGRGRLQRAVEDRRQRASPSSNLDGSSLWRDQFAWNSRLGKREEERRAVFLSRPRVHARLRVFKGSTQILENDDWSSGTSSAEITLATTRLGASALPAGSADAGLLVKLDPGVYSAHVTTNDTGRRVAW